MAGMPSRACNMNPTKLIKTSNSRSSVPLNDGSNKTKKNPSLYFGVSFLCSILHLYCEPRTCPPTLSAAALQGLLCYECYELFVRVYTFRFKSVPALAILAASAMDAPRKIDDAPNICAPI